MKRKILRKNFVVSGFVKKTCDEFVKRDEVDAATFTTELFNKPPVAKWPKLKPLFKRLPRVARSGPMMVVIKSVLQR